MGELTRADRRGRIRIMLPTADLSADPTTGPLDKLRAVVSAHADSRTGFLPARTPLQILPQPFGDVSSACAELAARYHGDNADCRPWLDALFAETRPAWSAALADAGRELTEALMTQVSLLCHAYRWRGMPTLPELYKITALALPPGLDALWSALAGRMHTPRVGIFYTMVANNWALPGRAGGEPYALSELGAIRLIHSWLRPPEEADLTAFIAAALQMEAQGRAVLDCMLRTYDAIERDNLQEVAFQLVVCRDAIRTMLDAFNGGIRKERMAVPNFMKLVQPTMLWLLDHGDGPLEGASGPQACTVQVLDNFLGVPRDSHLGGMILASRKYMLPGHRAIVEASDACSGVLRAYVERMQDSQLTALYNACIGTLITWRQSHQKRGAIYLKGAANEPPAAYASTGLVVGADADRVRTFETAMRGHIAETEALELVDPWAGRERTFEAVFRNLTEAQRARLRDAAERARCAAGEVLLAQGQRRPGLFVLEQGTAAIVRAHGPQRVTIARLQAGELFGEMSLLENEPAGAEVRARTECLVARIESARLYELMREDPSLGTGLYLGLGKMLSARLRRVNQILPELLDGETLGNRPMRLPDASDPLAAGETGWKWFCRENGHHRDFWPFWVFHFADPSSRTQLPPDSVLAELHDWRQPFSGVLGAAAEGDRRSSILHLGAGPALVSVHGAASVLLLDPSRRVAELGSRRSGVAEARHENIHRLAQGFGFCDLGAMERVVLDLLLGFYSDAALTDIFNWVHSLLKPGGEFVGMAFAPAAADCVVTRTYDVPLGRLRTEDQLNDLLTRSRFGTSPVDFVRSPAERVLGFRVCRVK